MSGSIVQEILVERGKTHGPFDVHARITQELKGVMVNSPNWAGMSYAQKESLEMVAHKIGRILSGNPDHLDHWDDMAGYSTLVGNALRKASSFVGMKEVA